MDDLGLSDKQAGAYFALGVLAAERALKAKVLHASTFGIITYGQYLDAAVEVLEEVDQKLDEGITKEELLEISRRLRK